MPLTVPVLEGVHVRLEPLTAAHREELRPAAEDERIWQVTLTRAMGSGFDELFDQTLAEQAAGSRAAFVVRLRDEGRVVGMTCFLDVALAHGRVEIGATWYHPSVWATAVNPECKLLLMTHAFDVLRVNRVAFATDALNARSQAAIAKLGAVREGVLRAEMISQGGRVRDTVLYSVVRGEWPAVRARLEARLATLRPR